MACFCPSAVIPTKVYKTGDGVFFQWVLCTGILFTGTVCFLIQCTMGTSCPKFEPLAVLGGAIWCTGNMMVVPVVKTIGLSLGLVIWGSANLIMGWASGKFGFFGLKPETIPNPALNYVGVVVAICSLALSFFVRPTVGRGEPEGDGEEELGYDSDDEKLEQALMPPDAADFGQGVINTDGGGDRRSVLSELEHVAEADEQEFFLSKLPRWQQQIVGVVLSIVSGLLYGVNFDPPQYIVDHPAEFPGAPKQPVELVFSHFVGIWMASTVYFLAYAVYMRNKPAVYPRVILPAIVSGVMWAIADICWFIANANLEFVVSFPLITMGPGIVGSLWGVFAFGEIRGTRNYLLLASVFVVAATGSGLIIASKF